ncbi:hypothetical protein CCR94_21565 [Rhodoblastus sphagnicola]|uniref:Secretin/TonB short N-terminal domain-containing protein n=2 Tax=Rhodoblastus sphagnicola TaxID=333368 RepID=A0A2S6MWH2_9HYPH|nr:secretin and TonB N-terminal domain-containing protein [Rhodoblastus sphagnicola]PPQ26707.1 hypothetical protein CCR94_21565 [Rhodoblastus sphagnicola]
MIAFSTSGSIQAATIGAAASPRGTLISFDIPSQPLASALDRYGDATGREVFYDAVLAAGRKSASVSGMLTPELALRALLAETGLSARFLADDTFVLLPTAEVERQPVVDAAPQAVRQRYYARIQFALRDAFCRSGAQPGRYRVVAVLWIGASGDLQRSQRLGSTGVSDIDRRIDATLRDVRPGEPPPSGFTQPVLIMIVPQQQGVTMGCGLDAASQPAARARP